jgi:hypothetical protein
VNDEKTRGAGHTRDADVQFIRFFHYGHVGAPSRVSGNSFIHKIVDHDVLQRILARNAFKPGVLVSADRHSTSDFRPLWTRRCSIRDAWELSYTPNCL